MRQRPWITWLVFAVCAVLVLDGLGWVTWQVLRLERRDAEATVQSDFEERARLALWRMDSTLTPIIAQESARPYFHYRPFFPAERAYTRMWEEVKPGEVLVASPLLLASRSMTVSADLIRLHFQIEPDGTITSPQVPSGNMLDLAESTLGMAGQIARSERLLESLRDVHHQARLALADRLALSGIGVAPSPDQSSAESMFSITQDQKAKGEDSILSKDELDYRQRVENVERSVSQFARPLVTTEPEAQSKEAQATRDLRLGPFRVTMPSSTAENSTDVLMASFRPTWLVNDLGEHELLFVRSVVVDGVQFRQGIWVDWPILRTLLLSSVLDLLPLAELQPINPSDSRGSTARVLASIPARLEIGPLPDVPSLGLTTVRLTLIVTWAAVLAAIAAIGFVLRASMRLGERRGRFVSAVTHELRTPLTTFCLYTEMLADGLVTEHDAKDRYLQTLKGESRRLAGIVENVLAYARLSRPKAQMHSVIDVETLLASVSVPLHQRAEQSGASLTIDAEAGIGIRRLAADAGTVERILVNLVDNACKYGLAEGESAARINLSVKFESGKVVFRVRDAGPGIPHADRGKIFSAFHRGAAHRSHAQSGLGLGLALARGLATELGGELTLEEGPGGCFALKLRAL